MPRFSHGNKASAGVAKPNAGRPPDWLKAKCGDLVDKYQLVEFLASVAAGLDFEQGVGDEGEVIKIPASIRDRLKAVEILLNRGFGKVDQDAPTTPQDSVIRAEQASRLLKELEAYSVKVPR